MSRQVIKTPGLSDLYEAWGITPSVRSGDLLFVGGQIGIKADGSPEVDPAAQIEKAFENLGRVLKSAGATFDDVVDLTAFYTNYPDHGVLARPIRERFMDTENPCPWTAVGVTHLANPFVFELKAIART